MIRLFGFLLLAGVGMAAPAYAQAIGSYTLSAEEIISVELHPWRVANVAGDEGQPARQKTGECEYRDADVRATVATTLSTALFKPSSLPGDQRLDHDFDLFVRLRGGEEILLVFTTMPPPEQSRAVVFGVLDSDVVRETSAQEVGALLALADRCAQNHGT